MKRFTRYELRTTDVDGARAFYASVLGHNRAVIWPLHEQAIARGARSHWLGHLGIEDVEKTAAAFIERGAVRLGPTEKVVPGGGQPVVLRDPGGAIVALATPPLPGTTPRLDVAWHELNTNDLAASISAYHELLAWSVGARRERTAHGPFHELAWHDEGENIGVVTDIKGRPGVHPHWLFFFEVDGLDRALGAARAAGGIMLASLVLPNGDQVSVGDDPQGAAFALLERSPIAGRPSR